MRKGQKFKGFKFENGTSGIEWNHTYQRNIGKIGIIECVDPDTTQVRFREHKYGYWLYPTALLEKHLLLDETELPEEGETILVSNDQVKWEPAIFLSYIHGIDRPMVCIRKDDEEKYTNKKRPSADFWGYWKFINKKVEISKQEIANRLGISLDQLVIVD